MFGAYDLNKTFKNGDRYKGEAIENSAFHGKGTYTWACGNRYTGEWSKGAMHGKGTFVHAAEGWSYTGAFAQGERDGQGKCEWKAADGTTVLRRYDGAWAGGEPCGAGTLTIAGLLTYTGCFRDGRMNGQGRARYDVPLPAAAAAEAQALAGFAARVTGGGGGGVAAAASSMEYEGEWADDAWEGEGRVVLGFACSGGGGGGGVAGAEYAGTFAKGAGTGRGRLGSLPAGRFAYAGAVVGLLPHGAGELEAVRDGGVVETYKGGFVQGLRKGRGEGSAEGVSGGGWRYAGTWLADAMHGQGRLEDAEMVYKGEFIEGVRRGEGTGEAKDGTWAYRGSWEGGRPHGVGVFTRAGLFLTPCLETGVLAIRNTAVEYRGGVVDGRMEGEGTAVYKPSMTRYKGRFAAGVFCGQGALWREGSKLRYDGAFLNGQLDGMGEAVRETHTYKGVFRRGEYAGVGRLEMLNGDYYEGGFDANVFNGAGTWYEAATSDTYEGRWVRGTKEGEGTEIKYGVYHYAGTFANGVKQGFGTLKFNTGDVYAGHFKAGAYHGEGTLTFADGSAYAGGFVEGARHGYGEETFKKSGATYKGAYAADAFDGEGTHSLPNGEVYKGAFQAGLKHGHGCILFPEGSRLSCCWVDDVLHGEGEYHFAAECKPPTIRVYHQGNLVSERPSVYDGPSQAVIPPPPAPAALSTAASAAVGNLRTQTAVEADHAEAMTELTTRLSELEADFAAATTPSQGFALKKKIALARAAVLRENRQYAKATAAAGATVAARAPPAAAADCNVQC